MRDYIYSLMIDKRDGFVASAIKGLLSFTAFFYGLIVKVIRPINMATAKKPPCRVISVGNMTLGGTGKTPAACMLVNILKGDGHKIALLIRGYGNDEWKMLKFLLGDVPVIVGRDRLSSALLACNLNSDTVVLDDGFQHWRLKRDLDIVLVDSTDPFGNRRLFPRGTLREDIKNLRRANIIMLTKVDMGKENVKTIKDELKRINPGAPLLESIHMPLWFYNLEDKNRIELSFTKGRTIAALSSIVNTRYFEYTLESLGANIISRFHYPDHYDYKEKDLVSIIGECKRLNIDTIVTTEKDAAKLSAIRYPLYAIHKITILVLHVELKVTYGEGVLHERLRSIYSG